MSAAWSAADDRDLVAIDQLALDAFETALLAVIRHHLVARLRPETQGWHHAYSIAAEHWGDTLGLPVSHVVARFVKYVVDARSGAFDHIDPFSDTRRDWVTQDEAALILTLHHMRRDQTSDARNAVADLTFGLMDPDVIRSGLSFANRFPAGAPDRRRDDPAPRLRVIR